MFKSSPLGIFARFVVATPLAALAIEFVDRLAGWA